MGGSVAEQISDLGHNDAAVRPLRLRRLSASQQVHDALRERIVSLDLVPGQNLSRAEIADLFRVSQTPVRDAMLKLEEEGLLVVYPQSRTEVARIDVEQARETQFLRLSIELEVTRRLVEAGDAEQLRLARRVLSLGETALAEHDMDRFARLDRIFHQSLCEAAGVSRLWDLVTARSGHIDRLRNLNLPDAGKPDAILSAHRQIISAIEAGDLDAATAAVRGHLSGTLATVEQIKARHPDYF
ncbi:GntR family transcriptional regulator [Rhodobacter sp. NSM]|uniref:GntR family transcriptional regulator n=1 Tax=Rhodobacter sp. NSM TaxID=3457501 RepID=UPI003FD603E2